MYGLDPGEPAQVFGRAIWIVAVLFVSCAYFYGGGGWNQDSRIDLVRALVEQHTLRIDSYQENTGDKALFDGHYYSDKAPGIALEAVPFVAAARWIMLAVGVDSTSPKAVLALSYLANLFTLAIPLALAAAVLFVVSLRMGSSVDGATFAAVAVSLATPIWAYATVFFGHTLAGVCLLLSFLAAIELKRFVSTNRDFWLALAAGLAAGWATVTEYPAAPASAIIALLALGNVWSGGWTRRSRVALGIAAGALPCAALLVAYQYAAFGSPFSVTYSHYQAGVFPEMNTGFHGLTYPKPLVALRLMLDPRLGLLLLAPVIVAAPWGLRSLWKQGNREVALASGLIFVYFWLLNASFYAWNGAWSYGPRYMLAGIPVLCIGLSLVWTECSQPWRRGLIALAACGIVFTMTAVSTTVIPPERFRVPLLQLNARALLSGRVAISFESLLVPPRGVDLRHASFNLGQLWGLHGFTSLVPLVVFWLIAVVVWKRMQQPAIQPQRWKIAA